MKGDFFRCTSLMPTLRACVTIALVLTTAVIPRAGTTPVLELGQQDGFTSRSSWFSTAAMSDAREGALSDWSRCGGRAPNELPSGVDLSQLEDAPFPGLSCPSGTQCFRQNEWYWQCLQECPQGWDCGGGSTPSSPETVSLPDWSRCGGMAPNDLPSGVDFSQLQDAPFPGVSCPSGTQCFRQSEWYWQCLQECPLGWACSEVSGGGSGTPGSNTAPDKSWCSETSSHDGYGLTAEDKCVFCEPTTYNCQCGNHPCYPGVPCPVTWSPFTLLAKGGYRHCVCSAGWWGRARGYPPNYQTSFDNSQLGCYWCNILGAQSAANASGPHECNTCAPDNQFTGKAPLCEPYLCQGSKTYLAFWNSYDKRCECSSGAAGKYPGCSPCASTELSLQISTDGTRDCFCPYYYGFVNETAKNGCRCDTALGYVPLAKPVSNAQKFGCTACNEVGNKKIQENGADVCSCDTSAGYGYPLFYKKLGNDSYPLPLCMTCSANNREVDSTTGFCKCKPGYGVWGIAYITDEGYCKLCNEPGYKLDADGWCVCADGFALDPLERKACIPCNGNGYTTKPGQLFAWQNQECVCDISYVPDIGKAPLTCSQCPSKTNSTGGFYANTVCVCEDKLRDNPPTCGCKFGYKEDASGRCQRLEGCTGNEVTAQFWDAAQVPGNWDGKQFPVQLMDATPAVTGSLKVPANVTTAAEWEAVSPGLGSVTKNTFAARYTGCLCRPDDDISHALYTMSTYADLRVIIQQTGSNDQGEFPVNVTTSGQGGGVMRTGGFGCDGYMYSDCPPSSIGTCRQVDIMQWALKPAGNAKLSLFFWVERY